MRLLFDQQTYEQQQWAHLTQAMGAAVDIISITPEQSAIRATITGAWKITLLNKQERMQTSISALG